MPMSLLILGVAVVAYFALHSILASRRVKDFLMAKLLHQRYYRLVFNGLSVLLLLPLAWLFFSMKKTVVCDYLLQVPLAGWLMVAAGVVLILLAFRGYDLAEFTGIFQIRSGHPPMHDTLNTGGLNAKVRHPLYLGILLVVWGWFVISPTDAVLLLAVLTSFYTYFGATLEERKLAQQFGEAYRSYQREVPMLLPFKWRKK
jgi:methanethiol S-methyltransferase